jgi:hypothetical protein
MVSATWAGRSPTVCFIRIGVANERARTTPLPPTAALPAVTVVAIAPNRAITAGSRTIAGLLRSRFNGAYPPSPASASAIARRSGTVTITSDSWSAVPSSLATGHPLYSRGAGRQQRVSVLQFTSIAKHAPRALLLEDACVGAREAVHRSVRSRRVDGGRCRGCSARVGLVCA